MKPKRKICVVITARPSYARIKTALQAIQAHPDLELQLVVAASAVLERYGGALKFIQADGFDIAATVYMVLEGENLVTSAKSTGLGMIELATVLDNLKPDMVVTVADRFETIATAIAAAYMNIPVAHTQGGEVSGLERRVHTVERDGVLNHAEGGVLAAVGLEQFEQGGEGAAEHRHPGRNSPTGAVHPAIGRDQEDERQDHQPGDERGVADDSHEVRGGD